MGNKESHQSEATTSLEDRQNKKSRRKSTKYEKTPEKVEAKPAPPSPLSIAPPPSNAPVKKIAILGGGPSALATAYYLTNIPDWKSKYQITIYQMGWRLGGKAARFAFQFSNKLQLFLNQKKKFSKSRLCLSY